MGDFILAIVSTAPQTYMTYLVNAGDVRVAAVTADTGGFASADDGLVEATGTKRSLGALAPHSAIELGREDEGSFDFSIWWRLELELESGERRALVFSVPKYFPLRTDGAVRGQVPVVDQPGWMFAPSA